MLQIRLETAVSVVRCVPVGDNDFDDISNASFSEKWWLSIVHMVNFSFVPLRKSL